jgi:hypothetical protein
MLIFLLSLWSAPISWSAPSAEVTAAQTSIKALIAPLLPRQAQARPKVLESFSVEGCEKHKINWMKVLLQQEEATLNFAFKEDCDIEGTIRPKVLTPFPAELALRNIENYKTIKAINKITPTLDIKPILSLDMSEGILTGAKGVVKFDATYRVRINTLSKDKILDENLGGEIHISEIYGKKVNIRGPIKVN